MEFIFDKESITPDFVGGACYFHNLEKGTEKGTDPERNSGDTRSNLNWKVVRDKNHGQVSKG